MCAQHRVDPRNTQLDLGEGRGRSHKHSMQLTSHDHVALLWAFSVLAPLTYSGCGVLTWHEVYNSNQPRGRSRVSLKEECGLADCSLRIAVEQGWSSTEIGFARGCVIDFAQAAWDGPIVGMFVDGGTCGQIRVAYDVASKQKVAFSRVEATVRLAIIDGYHVTGNELKAMHGDPFEWATYPADGNPRRSKDEFSGRYPH